jgi:hypothetical protein
MPYSACLEWFEDWISINPPLLLDEYDLVTWMEEEMNDANKMFISAAFKSLRAKNDAILILRALYYEYFLFQRDYNLSQLKARTEAVQRLKELPQSAQKSAMWHNETLELLTGHEFGSVVYGSPNGRARVIAKKCGVPVVVDETEAASSQIVFTHDSDGKLSAFKWGWRYEPVVRDLYERCFAEGGVFDGLGRIRHPTLPRLAASPDGLIVSGPRCGRLVEIKSPITRELTGTIPPDYYCQIQLQAEVCDVDAVDYIEMRFTSMMLKDAVYSSAVGAKNPWMGKICVVAAPPVACLSGDITVMRSDPATYEYRYSPLFPSTASGFTDCCAWSPTDISGMVILEETVWYVYDFFTKTYVRNRRWWAEVGQPAYEQFWRDVEIARRDGTFGEKAVFVDTSDDEADEQWEGVSSEEGEDATETHTA